MHFLHRKFSVYFVYPVRDEKLQLACRWCEIWQRRRVVPVQCAYAGDICHSDCNCSKIFLVQVSCTKQNMFYLMQETCNHVTRCARADWMSTSFIDDSVICSYSSMFTRTW